MAAGGVAGVITSPFQPVDQPSGSERGGDIGVGREGAEREGKSNKELREREYEPCQSTWGERKFHSCWW